MTLRTEPEYRILLGTSTPLGSVPAVPLYRAGTLTIHVTIDDGAGGAPTNNPAGEWQLFVSCDNISFVRYQTTAIDTALAAIAPNGNNLVDAIAFLPGPLPGWSIRLVYSVTSPAPATRARIRIAT